MVGWDGRWHCIVSARFGYKVTIVTVKPILYPEYDFSVWTRIDQAGIIRTGSLDPSRLLHLLGRRRMIAPNYGTGQAALLSRPTPSGGGSHS